MNITHEGTQKIMQFFSFSTENTSNNFLGHPVFFTHELKHVYSTPKILGFIFKSTLFDLYICLLTSIFRKLLWRLSESNWMSICLFMIIFNEKIVPNYCRLSVFYNITVTHYYASQNWLFMNVLFPSDYYSNASL